MCVCMQRVYRERKIKPDNFVQTILRFDVLIKILILLACARASFIPQRGRVREKESEVWRVFRRR